MAIVLCQKCKKYLDDEFRTTVCPHDTFPANDGKNNFRHHPEAYLSEKPMLVHLRCPECNSDDFTSQTSLYETWLRCNKCATTWASGHHPGAKRIEQKDETLKMKVGDTKDLREQFTEVCAEMVEHFRELTGTDLSAETFSPEIDSSVNRLLDIVSNTVIMDPH